MKLEINKLNQSIEGVEILKEIDAIIDFKVLGVVGPSGGGKSTLLRAIAGLIIPDRGEVFVNGRKIPYEDSRKLLSYRRGIGIVFQSWNLFPHLTALDNIVLPLRRVHNKTKEEAQAIAKELLGRFGLLSHKDKRPHELSGGQCQRVAIIRAVAIRPSLLMLDEPTSALDPLMTSEVLDLIVEMKSEGIACLLCTHHMGFLEKIADQAAFVHRGRLIQSGLVADLFHRSRHAEVVDYFSKVLKY